MAVDLLTLDVLPGLSSVEVMMDDGGWVCFRAHSGGTCSQWSGWFPMCDCPIAIQWAAFDWGDD